MASSTYTTPLPPNREHPIAVDLYCPDHRKSMTNFTITPSMTHDDIIVSIEAALGFNSFKDGQGRKIDQETFVCDINGQRLYDSDATTFNFNNIVDGEELLIGTKHSLRVRPSPKLEAVLYMEDDTGLLNRSVQRNGRTVLHNHISALSRKDASARKNIVRLVKPHSYITAKLNAYDNTPDVKRNREYSISRSKDIMRANWYFKYVIHQCSPEVLAIMAILSEATPGHSDILEDLIIDAKNNRIANPFEDAVIQEKDVKAVIRRLYRVAGAIDSERPGTDAKKNIAVHSAKKERYKGKDKMVEAPDEEVEELTGRLGQASIPNTMTADDKSN